MIPRAARDANVSLGGRPLQYVAIESAWRQRRVLKLLWHRVDGCIALLVLFWRSARRVHDSFKNQVLCILLLLSSVVAPVVMPPHS